jgi:Tol biopolymer transport system component
MTRFNLSMTATFCLVLCGPIGLSYAAPGDTELISVTADGSAAASGGSGALKSVSADGRFVAFTSNSPNILSDGKTGATDVFVRDRQTGKTERVSVALSGAANDESYGPSITPDGRFVTFYSAASNLVPGDTNGWIDCFLRDRQTGKTERVSVTTSGTEANDYSYEPSISADGRYVAFYSYATNLVPGDTNGEYDIFERDRQTGTTTRVSVDATGGQLNGPSISPSYSADGRYMAFLSYASNLVPGDTNQQPDVFVRDRLTGQSERVNVSSSGVPTGLRGHSEDPSISANGRYVVFQSYATGLVPGDTNKEPDIFVHDRQTGVTERVSVSSSGAQANSQSTLASISGDGRYVAFSSYASNLVPKDSNYRQDVFVHDRVTGVTQRVSVPTGRRQANGVSIAPSISVDGRFVVFSSTATNLATNDNDGLYDVFIHQLAK